MTDLPPPPLGGPNGGSGPDGGPGVRVLAQYIRDLSFENPLAPDSLRGTVQPQIELGVELNAKGRPDGFYDVEMKLSARAMRDSEVVFHIELLYGGLFQIVGVPEQDLEPVLMIECPRFPVPIRAAHHRPTSPAKAASRRSCSNRSTSPASTPAAAPPRRASRSDSPEPNPQAERRRAFRAAGDPHPRPPRSSPGRRSGWPRSLGA